MKPHWQYAGTFILVVGGFLLGAQVVGQGRYVHPVIWLEPAAVTPGESNGPPSDAVVLFNGKSFEAWKNAEKWQADPDGAFTAKGAMQTKQDFGDCQLHLEFASPNPPKGRDQGRGNNGVGFIGARYEIQVLDSFENKTYFEGQCASVYNQRPPMVNASRKPGEWQTFDIVFSTPRFDAEGKVTKPAYFTVLHNGVLVQNHTEVKGLTYYEKPNVYSKHPEQGPLVLMYHGDPVRFRNIWIREFKELESKPAPAKDPGAVESGGLMHLIVRIVGGIIGLVAADRAFVYSFRLFVPSRGCMSGFDWLLALPFWLVALVVGAVLGGVGGNYLLLRFWAWQARGQRRRHPDDEWV